jgi:phosphoglycolate phosphatase-like HAD superfamily hydrolase
MGIKQIQCFHPEIVRHWGLEDAETELRQAAEFVNLYSKWRGQNRFTALLQCFTIFNRRPEVREHGVPLPEVAPLTAFVESGEPLTNEGLRAKVEVGEDAELARLLLWSEQVDRVVEEKVRNLPPFEGVRDALLFMGERADLIVCSQTPEGALVREWSQQGIDGLVRVIAGQELGTKADHLRMASEGKYSPERVLMIGDAPGDRVAADAVGASFFPVAPGDEAASWRVLSEEAFPRFLEGTYRGTYEDDLVAAFEGKLPATPPWER